MGNKPAATFANPFTTKVAGNRRLAYYPYPAPFCGALILFVVDQLLIGEAALASNKVASALNDIATPTKERVFKGKGPGGENVQIWKLNDASGGKSNPDVAEAVWKLRKDLQKEFVKLNLGPEQVAPNHVLISAPNYHECPWGPPEKHGPVHIPDAVTSPSVKVVVIDSGYMPEGPIESRLSAPATYGAWFDPNANPPQWRPGTAPSPGTRHDQNNDKHLDALAGHANFVAGVIAQACPNASISVVSDNAAFLNTAADYQTIPTEAAVARSLWAHRNNDVINVGYAFPTLPNVELTKSAKVAQATGPPSWTLKLVLDALKNHDPAKPYIVAPAGNQSCTVPQYPAAFGVQGYDNVIGVGSVGAGNQRSVFSNHGNWVRCCADGEDVVSTFVAYWRGMTEDPEQNGGNPRKVFKGWASWSGTSFASPKVAAALACRVATQNMTLPDAWADLVTGQPAQWDDMGYLLSLPPF